MKNGMDGMNEWDGMEWTTQNFAGPLADSRLPRPGSTGLRVYRDLRRDSVPAGSTLHRCM